MKIAVILNTIFDDYKGIEASPSGIAVGIFESRDPVVAPSYCPGNHHY